jgi:hypothetical protein
VLTLVGWATALVVWVVFTTSGFNPVDANDFFVNPATPYSHPGFVYTPVAADMFGLLGAFGFPVFTAVIRAGETVALAWFAGPVVPIAVLLPPVATELNAANINLLLMVCVVLGFRWPALWTPVLLTKPTMGVGLLWFAWRREWRLLALAVGPTLVLVLVSVLIQPATWVEYLRTMAVVPKDSGWPFPWPIWQRAIVFIPLLLWAVRTERRRGVVLAVILAAPRLYFLSPVMLLGLLKTGSFQPGNTPDWSLSIRRMSHRVRLPALRPEAPTQ